MLHIRFRYLLAAGAVAAMVGAPAAVAADQTCQDIGNTATECSSPGNVQINDAPPVVSADPFFGGFYGGPYPVPFDEGGR
jgi:hypothetical protein